MDRFHIGTAGWQVAKTIGQAPAEGSHLERYAQLFNAVEINSVFYRPHLAKTFERWAATVPEDFRFSVKMHRGVTHERRLTDVRPAQVFLDMVAALGEKLGPVLVQLPPSLAWSAEREDFFSALRETYQGAVVLEARHPSWAAADVTKVLKETKISGVAADPPLIRDKVLPTGHPPLAYFRFHGTPRVYWSTYTDDFLSQRAEQITVLLKAGRTVWTIFDNSAAGAAAPDALRLRALVQERME